MFTSGSYYYYNRIWEGDGIAWQARVFWTQSTRLGTLASPFLPCHETLASRVTQIPQLPHLEDGDSGVAVRVE